MELKVKYYDGSVREGLVATLELLSESIKIQPIGEGYNQPVYWHVSQMKQIRHHKPRHVMLQHTTDSRHYLELSKEDFETQVMPYYRGSAFVQPLVEEKSSALKYAMALATVILATLAAVYFFVVPWVAERFAKVIPKETEVKIGEAMFLNTISQYHINDSATRIINDFFKEIKHPQDYDIKITVVTNPQVNAFAMPGGNIVVFDGIIKQMDSYPELAALLAHEFNHVQHRHTTRSIFRSMANYLFIAALFGDAGSVAGIIAENANSLKDLDYSRNLEHEADEEGFKLLVENNIDPKGMLGLFEKLEEAAKGQEIPEFLSTHPVTQSRKDFANKEINKGGFKVVENTLMKTLLEQLKQFVNDNKSW